MIDRKRTAFRISEEVNLLSNAIILDFLIKNKGIYENAN
jgi:hypothetical protein